MAFTLDHECNLYTARCELGNSQNLSRILVQIVAQHRQLLGAWPRGKSRAPRTSLISNEIAKLSCFLAVHLANVSTKLGCPENLPGERFLTKKTSKNPSKNPPKVTKVKDGNPGFVHRRFKSFACRAPAELPSRGVPSHRTQRSPRPQRPTTHGP